MRRLGWILFGVVAFAVVAVVVLNRPAVQDQLTQRAMLRGMEALAPHDALFKDDALRLLVCGSGAPGPWRDRARACLAVIAGGRYYVVDIGPGASNRLALLRMPAPRIGAVFVTHFHSDHIGDLGELNARTWFEGRAGPLKVYGPAGVERVVAGFGEAYAPDVAYRVAHHGVLLLAGASRMEAQALALAKDAPTEVFSDGDLKVTAFPVSHQPVEPAVGYRFDYKGRAIVISGDTRKDENLARFAKGADVLAHEAQNQDLVAALSATAKKLDRPRMAQILADIRSYHTSPLEAAELANAAEVPLLLLYHLMPAPPHFFAERRFMRGVEAIRKDGVALAHDGMLIELPLDSGEWRIRRLD